MQLTPYIIFDGNCEEALNFYAEVFGGKITSLNHYEGTPGESFAKGKNKIMHAAFKAKEITLMASDGGQGAPVEEGTGMIQLSLHFENVTEEEKVFNALGKNGTITMPLQDTFWGAHFGMLKDRFGIKWMFNCELKK